MRAEMLSRVTRLRATFSKLLVYPPSRFVSNTQSSGAAASTVVPELHRAAKPAEHGEVSQYVKVSSFYLWE